ncbi:B1065G12.18 [Oryza sativa Japonica Group]|uniref:B1065G12.18 protein n=2 Tax=Oryza sativa subsp. japonica TaxID=39947 RepID=Q8RZ77_ORYSJ|nr:B1065G12.18 [Oryza sativa Japonica Group]BAD82778.1 hypothetical protein [Oryza sativa Japonica Group]
MTRERPRCRMPVLRHRQAVAGMHPSSGRCGGRCGAAPPRRGTAPVTHVGWRRRCRITSLRETDNRARWNASGGGISISVLQSRNKLGGWDGPDWILWA